jgi:hemerythrin
MQKENYPDLEKHVKQHTRFTDRLNSVYTEYKSGTDNANISFMSLLGSWWCCTTPILI